MWPFKKRGTNRWGFGVQTNAFIMYMEPDAKVVVFHFRQSEG